MRKIADEIAIHIIFTSLTEWCAENVRSQSTRFVAGLHTNTHTLTKDICFSFRLSQLRTTRFQNDRNSLKHNWSRVRRHSSILWSPKNANRSVSENIESDFSSSPLCLCSSSFIVIIVIMYQQQHAARVFLFQLAHAINLFRIRTTCCVCLSINDEMFYISLRMK